MEQKGDNGVFAELHDMFGECVPRNVINEIGNKLSWDVTSTVDQLIKYIEAQNAGKAEERQPENPRIQYKVSECQENDRDLDVLIESENYTTVPGVSELQARATGAIRKQPRDAPQKMPNFANFLKNGENVFVDTTKKQSPVQKNAEHPLFEEVCKEINSGVKVMILMRGLPGSGKTYLSEKIVNRTVGGDIRRHIFSSDDFFYDVNGIYQYDVDKLTDAHTFNQNNVFKKAYDGWSPIIVDNTNMKLWEMLVYCKYAIRFGYIIRVMEPTTPWAWSLTKLSQKNKHRVPRESIERMLLKYEKLNSENELLPIFGMSYSVPMPQFRHHPPIIPKSDALAAQDPLVGNIEIRNDLRAPPLFSFVETSQLSSSQGKSGSTSDGSKTISPDQMAIDWPTHEVDVSNFWNTDTINPPKNTAKVINEVKDQRAPRKSSIPEDALLQMLKESIVQKKDDSSIKKEKKLEKHRKGCRNENESFIQVRQIYPTIPLNYLWDLFVNCKGDCEWTVDIILQEETHVPQSIDEGASNDFSCNCDGMEYKETPWEDVAVEIPVERKMTKEEVNIPTPQRQRNQWMKNATREVREDMAAAKRRVEEMICVKDEHLSDHVKKIRDIRRGIFPATSTRTDVTTTDLSPENVEMGAYGGLREQSPSSETSDPDSEETLEIDLGDTLINHMENLFFDGSICEKPKDLKTTVFMPMSLLRQLHALWVESLFNQLDEQRERDLKEDEKYARMLQQEDLGKSPDSFLQEGVDFSDMADMEITWAAYKSDKWHNTAPRDLASQLTRDKLYETFPEADRSFLDEILASNNYKFLPTVELLKESLGIGGERNVKSSGLKIIEEIKKENDTIDQKAKKKTDAKATDEKSISRKRNVILEDFEENRNKASYHTQLKTECYQKAQDAIRKSMPGVAGYYNQVANLHKKKIDEYNHRAANCIVEAHNLKQNSDMLDLHFLHVPEAIVCLDVFLDRHINHLRTQKKPYKFVFVITGRGLHSIGGVATIKHNAKNRLRHRKLKCSEVNPGLLKVKIFYNSKMAEET